MFLRIFLVFQVKIFKFYFLLAGHLGHCHGPPVVRGPQVENRCVTLLLYYILCSAMSYKLLTYNYIDYTPHAHICKISYLSEACMDLNKCGSCKILPISTLNDK